MSTDDLRHEYHRLREALEAAYAAPSWDTRHIDGITEQMLAVELALASRRASWAAAPPSVPTT